MGRVNGGRGVYVCVLSVGALILYKMRHQGVEEVFQLELRRKIKGEIKNW